MTATILLQMGGLGGYSQFLPLVLIIVVFYFFMIRPQMKKQKDQKTFANDLKKGDKIVTTAGIHGKIAEVAEATILIETEGGGKIRFNKSAVALDESKALSAPVSTK
ncbi:preprotein translocase subunit YajC [Mucilaginibacter antarcticus]|uniref:Sec translocon accessory complex subunit YajC n=1 Tax=Mucilaginibacter antarcticus TaxID=1855725 RepID=A0ABW5XNY0_9SPHI